MKLRAIILSAALCVGALASSARNVNAFIINRTDGVKDRLALHADLKVQQSPEGDLLLVHPSVTVCYPLDLVKYISPGFQSFSAGQYYIGDHVYDPEAGSIQSPEVDGMTLSIADGLVTLSGVNSEVKIIDLQGKTLLSVSPSDGCVEIKTSQFPAGVYILNVNQTALKIKL
ncbi:MAG: T9SS type A sorting domain-containing protein [Muribaculaceae bacterium]|nr:T9SS type A sorting domain-containing protein [Muribaculaceae bacterium]